MKPLLFQMIIGFISSASFAVLINVPKGNILLGGFIGSLGWAGYWSIHNYNGSVFIASVACAFILSVASQIASVKRKQPTIIFFVPGLVPVVPGITFFKAFNALISQEYLEAVGIFINVMYTAVGIACGVTLSTILYKIYLSIKKQPKKG